MYDTMKIIFGLIVFVVFFTAPMWFNSFGTPDYKPEIVYPANHEECIAPKEYMNHYHMNVLDDWRDQVVRADIRFFLKDGAAFLINGEKAEKSLSHTCMKCHNNKSQFCDRCHDYLAVKPYCWDCHVAPEEVKK